MNKIDEAAKGEYASRSDYIRETLVRRLKGQRIVDEWGDDGSWETVVDFGKGVSAQELINRFKQLNG